MLKELIDFDCVSVEVEASDWKDAIRKSGELLLNSGKITSNYIDAMLENVEENGPYIVIAEHVALPHARPEEGALGLGLSICVLKEPIKFGHETNDPVKYVFCLSAVDSSSHLEVLSDLMELLQNQEFYLTLDKAISPDEIIDFIQYEKFGE